MVSHNKFFYLIVLVMIPELLFISTYLSHNNMSFLTFFLYCCIVVCVFNSNLIIEYINIKH